MDRLMDILSSLTTAPPRPGLHLIPGTTPLTPLPLLFLPPAPPPAVASLPVVLLRNVLALLAAVLFLRLPLAYHVPQSIGLTYLLGLVGLYGAAKIVDAFLISPYWFGHIPRRVRYKHESRVGTSNFEGLRDVRRRKSSGSNAIKMSSAASSTAVRQRDVTTPKAGEDSFSSSLSSYFFQDLLTGPQQKPVHEHAIPEDGWPHTLADRASWALELEPSMRGVEFTWTTADVQHTRKTWLPTISSRVHSILVHVVPVLLICFVIVRSLSLRYGFATGVDEALGTTSQ